MAYLLRDLDPAFALAILIPAGLLIAAWALQMACSFSSVEPPEFFQAVLSVIVICIANVVLHFFLQVTQVPPGLESYLLAPLLTTMVIIALSVQTGPFSALLVTVVHLFICGATFYSLTLLCDAVVVGIVN